LSIWAPFFYLTTTVHKDVTERLQVINHSLYDQVKIILDENKAKRHLRGGLATKQKYHKLKRAEA